MSLNTKLRYHTSLHTHISGICSNLDTYKIYLNEHRGHGLALWMYSSEKLNVCRPFPGNLEQYSILGNKNKTSHRETD